MLSMGAPTSGQGTDPHNRHVSHALLEAQGGTVLRLLGAGWSDLVLPRSAGGMCSHKEHVRFWGPGKCAWVILNVRAPPRCERRSAGQEVLLMVNALLLRTLQLMLKVVLLEGPPSQ
jgi:hypothetical protein